MVEGNYVNRRRYKVASMFKIGIMQGRLLPWYKNNYQSHPVNYWESEFYIAKDLGFTNPKNGYDMEYLWSKWNQFKDIELAWHNERKNRITT